VIQEMLLNGVVEVVQEVLMNVDDDVVVEERHNVMGTSSSFVSRSSRFRFHRFGSGVPMLDI
jgi:hypothetical protein